MSCDVSVVVVGGAGHLALAADALERVHDLEQRWSRFLPESEISRLNAARGEPVQVSEVTRRLVVSLVEAFHSTGGAFDPTVLRPLIELGYDAQRTDSGRRTVLDADAEWRGRPDRILVDERRSTVQLPPGTVLDPGGLGKGLAADIVVEELLDRGASGALVEIGGDLRVAGDAPAGEAWTVAIEQTPGQTVASVQLRDGGVATSTTLRRRWTHDGRAAHHLIDPTSGAPTSGPVETVTVVAGSARWAEALTKPAFVVGQERALAMVDAAAAAALIASAGGAVCASRRWSSFVVPGETTRGRGVHD